MNDLNALSQSTLFIGFAIFIIFLLQYISHLIMNYESATTNGESSETEDLLLSESEDAPTEEMGTLLNIDYNARFVSQEGSCSSATGDDCDMQFIENSKRFLCSKKSEDNLDTSTEDLNISDEEGPTIKPLILQCLNLDGIASICAKTNPDSASTLSYSSTVFKEGYVTDAEYASDDERVGAFNEKPKGRLSKFSSAFAVAGLTTAIKSASSVTLPSTLKPLSALNITNAFSKSLLIADKDLIDFWETPQSPLLTCQEFLKEEFSDENNTDAEDISVGSADESKPELLKKQIWEGGLNVPGHAAGDEVCPGEDSRRSSIVEFLTEDETFSMDVSCNRVKKRLKRHLVKLVPKDEMSEGSCTDEELLDEGVKGQYDLKIVVEFLGQKPST